MDLETWREIDGGLRSERYGQVCELNESIGESGLGPLYYHRRDKMGFHGSFDGGQVFRWARADEST